MLRFLPGSVVTGEASLGRHERPFDRTTRLWRTQTVVLSLALILGSTRTAWCAPALRFQEKPSSGVSTLLHSGARLYNPAHARFPSADSGPVNIANPQTLSRYPAFGNNPARFVDPDGRAFKDVQAGQFVTPAPATLAASTTAGPGAELRDVLEAATGRDLLTGDKLAWYWRIASGFGAATSLATPVSAGAVRSTLRMVRRDQVAKDILVLGSGKRYGGGIGTMLDIDPDAMPDMIGDIRALPLRDSSQDLIIFERVPRELFAESSVAIKEASRVLRKGGRIEIETGRAVLPVIARQLREAGFRDIKSLGGFIEAWLPGPRRSNRHPLEIYF